MYGRAYASFILLFGLCTHIIISDGFALFLSLVKCFTALSHSLSYMCYFKHVVNYSMAHFAFAHNLSFFVRNLVLWLTLSCSLFALHVLLVRFSADIFRLFWFSQCELHIQIVLFMLLSAIFG